MTFEQLPLKIREYVNSDLFFDTLFKIADNSDAISKPYYPEFVMIVMQVIVGYHTLQEVVELLINTLGVDPLVAKKIAQEIYSILLIPIKNDILKLRENYLETGKEISVEEIRSIATKSQSLKESMGNSDSKINNLINK